ncbi:hypothetical protein WJ972_13855 [Achromobacter insuavis]
MTAAMTSRTPVIAALDAGTYYHHRTFHTPELTPYLDRFIYLPELDDAALADCDALIVSCRTHPDLLVPHRARFARFLASGKTLVAMGETGSHRWLDGVHWTDCEVNFWWWKTLGADSGLRLAQPAHPLFSHLTLADATWHQHGTFTPPPGAVSLIDKAGAGLGAVRGLPQHGGAADRDLAGSDVPPRQLFHARRLPFPAGLPALAESFTPAA